MGKFVLTISLEFYTMCKVLTKSLEFYTMKAFLKPFPEQIFLLKWWLWIWIPPLVAVFVYLQLIFLLFFPPPEQGSQLWESTAWRLLSPLQWKDPDWWLECWWLGIWEHWSVCAPAWRWVFCCSFRIKLNSRISVVYSMYFNYLPTQNRFLGRSHPFANFET